MALYRIAMKNTLNIENLCVKAGKIKIVTCDKLTIDNSAINIISGSNGTGKSSLVNALFGSPNYTLSGVVKFNGENIIKLSPEDKFKIGMYLIFQKATALKGISALELMSSILKDCPMDLLAKMNDLAIRLGLSTATINIDMHRSMSGGESKKIELIMASLIKPKLLVLDEFDSGLDKKSAEESIKIINEISASGTTIIIISHSDHFIGSFNNRNIFNLVAGQLLKGIK